MRSPLTTRSGLSNSIRNVNIERKIASIECMQLLKISIVDEAPSGGCCSPMNDRLYQFEIRSAETIFMQNPEKR